MIGSISISKASSSYIWRRFFFSTSFNWIVDDLFSISGSPSSSSSFWTHQWMWLSLLNRIFSRTRESSLRHPDDEWRIVYIYRIRSIHDIVKNFCHSLSLCLFRVFFATAVVVVVFVQSLMVVHLTFHTYTLSACCFGCHHHHWTQNTIETQWIAFRFFTGLMIMDYKKKF